ncbi:hypothetical protein E2C01_088393 [Portunus trituberculatus]|uniref:Uncharacterized protein n=1 Tax=Portunus trituberculatus TaxID=210409 RepID=A0A5B7JJQ8_PORTR|nr:hypothetical protein [Portunus trituberculatus]
MESEEGKEGGQDLASGGCQGREREVEVGDDRGISHYIGYVHAPPPPPPPPPSRDQDVTLPPHSSLALALHDC